MPKGGKGTDYPASDLAKFSIPRSRAWVKRERIFARLEKALQHPLTWIGASAGAGKTTLLASYLEERSQAVLWYNMDEADADPATLFYYLRSLVDSVARRENPLPLLTPDYLAGIHAYARNFFREFFRLLSRGSVIVFDNVQDVLPQATFLELLDIAVIEAPPKIAIVCLSRDNPPPELSRAVVNGQLTQFTREDLRWSDDEVRNLADSMSLPALSADNIQWLQKQTDGWIAGLTLLLPELTDEDKIRQTGGETEQTIFNYFSREIFSRFTVEEQNQLLTIAFLPETTVSSAAALTGNAVPTNLLERLASRNYFTVKLPTKPPSYRFHPLFREFLLHQAILLKPQEELNMIRTAAAQLLADEENYAASVALLVEAQQWNLLDDLLCRVARTFVAEGRHRTLLDWFEEVPTEALCENPWLLYWKAAALMPIDFDGSHKLFSDSYEVFRKRSEKQGMVMAWSGAVETVVHSLSRTDRLDYWAKQIEEIQRAINLDEEAELQLVMAPQVVAIYALRGNLDNDLEKWLTRAQAVVAMPIDPTQRIMASFSLVTYFHWSGQPSRSEAVLQQQQAIVQSISVAPLAAIITSLCRAWFSWIQGRYEQCTQAIEEGLNIVEQSGVQHWTFILLIQGVTNALLQGKLADAKRYLSRLAPLSEYARDMDRAYLHNESAWLEMLAGNPEQAVRQQLSAVAFAESMGAPFVLAETYYGMSQAYHAVGDMTQAWDYLYKARAKGDRYGSHTLAFQCGLAEVQYRLVAGETEQSKRLLRDVLSDATLKGYTAFAWWQRDAMSRLCMFALINDIEPNVVISLIRQFDVPPPPDAALAGDKWPWPVRIHTLGTFQLLVDNTPVVFDRKAQKKPLDLLKVIVALGGIEIPEGRIIDALWPDADADMAHQNLKSTMHRLRKLIPPIAVTVAEGRISLDPRYCWLDLFTLHSTVAAINAIDETTSTEELEHICQKLKNSYQGNFLDQDDDPFWAIAPRERYRALFLQSTEKLGGALLHARSYESARECYEHGLAIDPLIESFYQGLMYSYWGLARPAEVRGVLARCRQVLQASLGLDCSPETEALAQQRPS